MVLFLFQLYVVYMGSGDGYAPDEIVSQNHQILTTLHEGRLIALFLFLSFVV